MEKMTFKQANDKLLKNVHEDKRFGRVMFDESNPKTGGIVAVSTLPFYTCPHDAPCYRESMAALALGKLPACYAMRLLRFTATTKVGKSYLEAVEDDAKLQRYALNTLLLITDRDSYFKQIEERAVLCSFFRWHDSGDIMDLDYLDRVVGIAKRLKHTQFGIYTKRFQFVNAYIDAGHKIPKNLHIMFSYWGEYRDTNPYNMPTFEAKPKEDLDISGAYICPCSYHTHKEHTCVDCILSGRGCYLAKRGEKIEEALH